MHRERRSAPSTTWYALLPLSRNRQPPSHLSLRKNARSIRNLLDFGAYHQDVENPDKLLETVKASGLQGIKLHSDFQRCNIDDPKLMPIYGMLCELDMCVLFHMGDDRYDFSAPKRLARVLEKYPKLKCIGAHFGGYQRWKEAKECLAGAGENLYFDTSSSLGLFGKGTGSGHDLHLWAGAYDVRHRLSHVDP